MKITQISAWQVDLPLKEGRYNWSNGNSVSVFDSTVVEIKTDEDLYGYAECCPLGSAYLPSFAHGVRAGLTELAPHLIGCDPTNIQQINQVMDGALRGHPYAKAPIDIACSTISGQSEAGLKISTISICWGISAKVSKQVCPKIVWPARRGLTGII